MAEPDDPTSGVGRSRVRLSALGTRPNSGVPSRRLGLLGAERARLTGLAGWPTRLEVAQGQSAGTNAGAARRRSALGHGRRAAGIIAPFVLDGSMNGHPFRMA